VTRLLPRSADDDLHRELDQLCNSEPFQLFCRSSLPSEEQRLICLACERRRAEVSPSQCPSGAPRPIPGLQLQVWLSPEEAWELQGLPAWDAPYVWESNF